MTRLTQSAADAMAEAYEARNDALTEREVATDPDTHDARIATAAYPGLPLGAIWAGGIVASWLAIFILWPIVRALWRVM